jgi:D-alanine-D-alanine ligase
MQIGITYDLRDHYRSLGFPEEDLAEFDSIATINAIDNTLKDLGFITGRIGNIKQFIDSLVKGRTWDLIFNIAEGICGIGREAQIPALCDAYRIPYTFSDPCVLSLTLNKYLTKRVVRDIGLATPDFMLIQTPDELENIQLPYPLFAKPYAEGTGKGINAASVIRDKKSLIKVCTELISKYKQPVLVETYLPGREFTVGIFGSGREARVIGILEVALDEKAEAGAYSYLNKESCEDLVAYSLVEDETAVKSAELALKAWKGIGCFDAGRVDVRCDGSGVPNFVEVNPLAGLHPEHSDLPIICTKAGILYKDLIRAILYSCLKRFGLLDKAPETVKNINIRGMDLNRSLNIKKEMKNKVIIIHQYVPDDAPEDERDVLVQRDEIADSLKNLGYDVLKIAATLDLEALRRTLLQYKQCMIFNLVESLGGNDRLAGMVPALLDTINMDYTGSKSGTIAVTGDKITAKRLMNQADIPTPPYFLTRDINDKTIPAGEYIIKSAFDHASIGISGDSIIRISGKRDKSIIKKIEKIVKRYNSECFMELYIPGREFNVSILSGEKDPEVLPIAEINFSGFPEGKTRIVDYKAKWDSGSFEYKNTDRIFDFKDDDNEMLATLKSYALKCWAVFSLRGYGRVDFRVDESGKPWVLEINSNPCLSSDAGFMAAASRKGMGRDEVIKRILNIQKAYEICSG